MFAPSITAGLILATTVPAAASPYRHSGPSNPASATVENDRAIAVKVYADVGAMEVFLGTVPAYGDETFVLPTEVMASTRPVDFFVRSGRGFDQSTGDLRVTLGESIGIVVPDPFAPAASPPPPPNPADTTTATVENDGVQPVSVDLERGISDLHLGTVSSKGTRTFSIPAWVAGASGNTVQFFVHPNRGVDQDTDELTLLPGEHLRILVPVR